MSISPVNMNFSYAEAFGVSSANGYERLLLDAMLGDGRCSRIATAWRRPGR
jgi:glucose-6-phosphate 1-dehydrogenase